MIQKTSGELELLDGFHRALLLVIQRYSIPPQAQRMVLNCRQRRYDQTGQGLHPIEIQFRRTSASEDWQVVCLASFLIRKINRVRWSLNSTFISSIFCVINQIAVLQVSHIRK